MDDISWSEPAPRGRRAAVELDPPPRRRADPPSPTRTARRGDAVLERGSRADERSRVEERHSVEDRYSAEERHSVEDRYSAEERHPLAGGYRVVDYLGDGDAGWQPEIAEEPPVIEYTGELSEEDIWGPRPKLMAAELGGRRTVVITGHATDRYIAPRSGSRDSLPMHARNGFQADRTAMWAVLLCVILLLVAITSH